jgi:hypothetical protein
LIALFFGFVCLAVAFLAQFLGGVLQASLTIFGVVGGPLLALFSLGMFTTTANEKVKQRDKLITFVKSNIAGCTDGTFVRHFFGTVDGFWQPKTSSTGATSYCRRLPRFFSKRNKTSFNKDSVR